MARQNYENFRERLLTRVTSCGGADSVQAATGRPALSATASIFAPLARLVSLRPYPFLTVAKLPSMKAFSKWNTPQEA